MKSISGFANLSRARSVFFQSGELVHAPASVFQPNNATLSALAALGDIDADTYTPALTSVTNVAGSTAYACRYIRLGGIVMVSGLVDIDPTAAAPTDTQLDMSLPIASNFSAVSQLSGTASNRSNGPCSIVADASNDRASFLLSAQSTANATWAFQFTYQII